VGKPFFVSSTVSSIILFTSGTREVILLLFERYTKDALQIKTNIK
jgi:hypothetical protein